MTEASKPTATPTELTDGELDEAKGGAAASYASIKPKLSPVALGRETSIRVPGIRVPGIRYAGVRKRSD